jgi:hypothetical protein
VSVKRVSVKSAAKLATTEPEPMPTNKPALRSAIRAAFMHEGIGFNGVRERFKVDNKIIRRCLFGD